MMARLALTAAGGLLLAAAYPALSATTPDSANVAHGREVYEATGCYECHGHVGQGGLGPKLAPGPLPLQAFAAYVRSPAREMPPYSKEVLSARDIVDIHAFLATVAPLSGAEPKALEALAK